jgi:hypothetical protein
VFLGLMHNQPVHASIFRSELGPLGGGPMDRGDVVLVDCALVATRQVIDADPILTTAATSSSAAPARC